LEKLEAELKNLVTQANNHKSVITSWDMSRKDLALTEIELQNLLMQAGINCGEDSIGQAISDFEVDKNHQKWER
jgi:hypothetical protein